MHKFIRTLVVALLSCSTVQAYWPETTTALLEVGIGYRQDRLEWITSTHLDKGKNESAPELFGERISAGLPSKLSSKLKWNDLQIWQIEARAKYVTCNNIYMRSYGDYGRITSGKNRDTDHMVIGSGPEHEFARSHSDANGHVYDANIALGYQFTYCDASLLIAPLVGYSWHGQHFRDFHLKQQFFPLPIEDSSSGHDSYDFGTYSNIRFAGYSHRDDAHSTYNTRWYGPFIGFDFDYRFWCDWALFGSYEFHWARYHARAHWNLRADLFKGFHHRVKDAYGQYFNIGLRWDFCDCWMVAIKGQFQWWQAHHGHDRALVAEKRFDDVKINCHLTIPLKEVKWCSASISLNIGMVF